jgi:5S rRNA maturation endonuclease (ribonuclease M5)
MNAPELVQILEQRGLAPKPSGPDRWQSLCPAHEDRVPSLSIGTGHDDCLLLKCHAGCTFADVLASLDVQSNGNGRPEPTEYIYHDAAGEIAFKVVRKPGKRFFQARPDGAGDWIWDMQGVERVLYRLPRLLAAVAEGQTIYLAEGEKDVHALERAGVTASTNPGGALKWRDSYSEALAGAGVVIVADRDDTGRRHAQEVARSLTARKCRVRIVEAAKGKDAADHLAAGLTVDDFTATDSPTPSAERVIIAESFTTIRAERTRWLWDGRIPLGAPTLLVGREKLGKSTLTNELAARLTRGELPGDLAGEPVDVLVVGYEDNAGSTVKPRLLAAGADPARVHRIRAEYRGSQDLVSFPDDVERIAQCAREHGARLLVIDPFSASLGADVNSHRDQDIRRAIAPLAQLAEDADLAVLLVAHFNKAQGGDSLSRVLGSRGLTAAVRSVLVFGKAPDAEDGSPDRVLAHAACNVAREAPSLSCRVEARVIEDETGTIETSRLVIVGDCDTDADALLATRSDDERTDREIAADWLADKLADREWHGADKIRENAKTAGIAERTLYRARKLLGVKDRREGFQAVSEWRLPNLATPPGKVGGEDGWQSCENGSTEPNPAPSDSQPCQVSDSGKVGPSEPLWSAKPDAPATAGEGSLAELAVERYGGAE